MNREKSIEHLVYEDHNIRIQDLEGHAKVANKEMGEVNIQLAVHTSMLDGIKEDLKSLKNKQWAVILIIITAAIGVLLKK